MSVASRNVPAKQALVAFGSNLPEAGQPPEATISAAIAQLALLGAADLRVSRMFRSPCFPPGAGPDYVNAAASMTWRHAVPASEILANLHEIEARFGRERQQRWGMRTLDLDLLALGDSVLPDAATQDHWRNLPADAQRRLAPDRLILPHPRLQDRAFVLVPLCEVAPDWVHPRLGLSVVQMRALLSQADIAEVTPL